MDQCYKRLISSIADNKVVKIGGRSVLILLLSLLLPIVGTATNYVSDQDGKWKAAFNWKGGGHPKTFNDNATIQHDIHIESGNSPSVGNVSFNNGGSLHVRNGGSLTVDGTLDLTDGSVDVDPNGSLMLTENATLKGITDSTFIDGPYQMKGSDSLVFKLKGANGIIKLAIHKLTMLSAFKVGYHGQNPQNQYSSNFNAPIESISHDEYFDIQRTEGSGTAMVSLYWNQNGTNTAISTVQSLNDLTVAHYNQTTDTWEDYGHYKHNGSKSDSGYLVSDSISGFSPFTFGSTSTSSPLPVELINFDVQSLKDGNELKWATASETNNRFFVVQRSTSGKAFKDLDTVQGNGTTTEMQQYRVVDQLLPESNTLYYRLKQVDFDGTFEYSSIEAVSTPGNFIQNGLQFHSLAPNPARFPLKLTYATNSKNPVRFIWVDPSGKRIATKIFQPERGKNSETLRRPRLMGKSGIYLITLEQNGQARNRKVIFSQ